MDTDELFVRRTRGLGASVAAHVVAVALLIGAAAAPGKGSRAQGAGGPLAQKHVEGDEEPRRVEAAPNPPPRETPLISNGSTALLIPGFAFDVSKIAARAPDLFPFLDLQLSIEAAPGIATHRDEGGLVFVQTVASKTVRRRPPLRLSPSELQTIVDAAWSRRTRWIAFRSIRTIADADRYDPDRGDLAHLLRTYVDEDLLQPYEDTTIPDPRLWTQLGIAADHADFVHFITAYAARHPSTRTTTELLFLLDKLAQASRDALTTLLDTKPADLRWTIDANPAAYRLLKAIRSMYVERLGDEAHDRAALKRRYDAVRLTILQAILRTTPEEYRANDARFLIGTIQWRSGDRDAAIRTWRRLHAPQPSDYYAASSSDILGAMTRSGAAAATSAEVQIDGILAGEDARWLAFSSARLKRFGYAIDTF